MVGCCPNNSCVFSGLRRTKRCVPLLMCAHRMHRIHAAQHHLCMPVDVVHQVFGDTAAPRGPRCYSRLLRTQEMHVMYIFGSEDK